MPLNYAQTTYHTSYRGGQRETARGEEGRGCAQGQVCRLRLRQKVTVTITFRIRVRARAKVRSRINFRVGIRLRVRVRSRDLGLVGSEGGDTPTSVEEASSVEEHPELLQ